MHRCEASPPSATKARAASTPTRGALVAFVIAVDRDLGANAAVTYAITGERGSGKISINGAAAHLVQPGDLVIIMAYGLFEDADARRHEPTVVHVDGENRVVQIGNDPAEAVPGMPGQVSSR